MSYVKAAAMQKQQPQSLNPNERAQWNAYIDYLEKKGMKGNPALDNRDTGLSQQLFNEYKAQNPSFSLTYDRVPAVQQDLQDYRGQLVNKWKANPTIIPGVKSADEIMSDLSPVDSWLGSKTSSHKYPVAMLNNNGTQQNFGTDIDKYNAAISAMKNVK